MMMDYEWMDDVVELYLVVLSTIAREGETNHRRMILRNEKGDYRPIGNKQAIPWFNWCCTRMSHI